MHLKIKTCSCFLKDFLDVRLPATHGHVTILLHITIFIAAVHDITGIVMQQQFCVASL